MTDPKWMLFVDGENFTCRGQEIAKAKSIPVVEGRFHRRDAFLWVPFDDRYSYSRATDALLHNDYLYKRAVRAYYFTSVSGDENAVADVRSSLWSIGFTPEVFKRDKQRGSKGVDIALTKEMLSHAFRDNYDVAALVAGDADYVPLVEEVKRLGKRVHLWFFDYKGLSDRLKLACDQFDPIGTRFTQSWSRV